MINRLWKVMIGRGSEFWERLLAGFVLLYLVLVVILIVVMGIHIIF